MMQKEYFMRGEGNAWLDRNRHRLGVSDPVCEMIDHLGIRPTRALEVGCADGWRLEKLRHNYGTEVMGVEPSMQACVEGAARRVPMHQMTASCLPVIDGGFDLIIYGFCLYLTDPKDWFTIVAEGDRALADGGYLIVHDFIAPEKPYAKHYEHRAGILSYHVDFARLWASSPLYVEITKAMYVASRDQVTVLRKLGRASIEVVK